MFQSSSDPKAGCNSRPASGSSGLSRCFNPHPTQRPDATAAGPPGRPEGPLFQSSSDPKAGCNGVSNGIVWTARYSVSILIRPKGRMQLDVFCTGADTSHVSILIRPKGRMQLPRLLARPEGVNWFQSSSDPKAGCNSASRPSQRPPGRVFQSSSDPKAGCNVPPWRLSLRQRVQFQSSSDPKAGCNRWRHRRPRRRVSRFNPHPTQRPDATLSTRPTATRTSVSILIRPKGRMQLNQDELTASTVMFQSSSDPKAGCNLAPPVFVAPTGQSFNPHPTQRPDATRDLQLLEDVPAVFQSSSDPKAGCN